jgi:hypothetical protein
LDEELHCTMCYCLEEEAHCQGLEEDHLIVSVGSGITLRLGSLESRNGPPSPHYSNIGNHAAISLSLGGDRSRGWLQDLRAKSEGLTQV